jgi:Carboxypeptidase regulatory-like domain
VHDSADSVSPRVEVTNPPGSYLLLLTCAILSFAALQFSIHGENFFENTYPAFGNASVFVRKSVFAGLTGGIRPDLSTRSAAAAVPPDSAGTVSGRVTYEGTPPKFKPLDMRNEPTCAQHYTAPPMPEGVVTGPNNSLQNVVVYVSAGAPDEPAPSQVVVLKQRGCRYTPHVVVLETNQEVWVHNDDSITHTVHPMSRINHEWNRSQPPGTPAFAIKYDKPEFIRLRCELHPWMRGVFAILKNSHYAVSDESGSFSLAGLPPGKYTITAWHETYGDQSQVVTVGSGEAKKLEFKFKVTPY